MLWRAIDLARHADQPERAALFQSGEAIRDAFSEDKPAAIRRAESALKLSRGRDVEYGASFVNLEICRQRAKRVAWGALGRTEFNDTAARWKQFVAWCRFNVVSSRIFNPGSFLRKRFWAEQRSALAQMIRRTLEERFYAALSEDDMKRIVRLLKEEFRRGRHPVRLRALLTGDHEKGSDLLFRLLSKKLPLVPLPGTALPYSVLASERGERFKAALARRAGLGMQSTGGSQADNPASPSPLQANGAEPTGVKAARQEDDIAQSDADLSAAVSRWLEANVDRRYWEILIDLVIKETLLNPRAVVRLPVARTLDAVIADAPRQSHL